jgi:hypothetical protein
MRGTIPEVYGGVRAARAASEPGFYGGGRHPLGAPPADVLELVAAEHLVYHVLREADPVGDRRHGKQRALVRRRRGDRLGGYRVRPDLELDRLQLAGDLRGLEVIEPVSEGVQLGREVGHAPTFGGV